MNDSLKSSAKSSVRHRPRSPFRRAGVAAAAVLATGTLVLTGLTGQAAAGPADGPTDGRGTAGDPGTAAAERALSPGLLQAMRTDLGLSRAQATERLGNEADAAATAERLRERLGDSYAGAHVSGRTAERLTVATTDARRTAAIEAAGATARVVDRSLKQLDGVRTALDEAAADRTPRGVHVWYVDVAHNRVVVEAAAAQHARALLDRPASRGHR